MTSKRDIKRAVTRHTKALIKQLTPDTVQEEVLEAITDATNTIWRGWFRTEGKAPDWHRVDPVKTRRDCALIIRFADGYAWVDDSLVIYEGMTAGEMANLAWGAIQHCLCQALADHGYDLHAEQPLAKVIYEDLTGRRMAQEKFGNWCLAAFQADPILDLVVELSAWGISESQLANLLKTQPELPQPFTVAVRNKYRTFHLTNP